MISIVIPALNEETYLGGCLKSLKEQDYPGEYEIIVADNGSLDGTAGIARRSGVRVVSCSERRSVCYARQAGAEAARGDIIVQADADSTYPKDWLRRIAEHFASHPQTVAVTGRFFYSKRVPHQKLEYFLRHLANRLAVALFGRPLVISGATFAFRRSAFAAAGGYRGLSYAADQYGIASRLRKSGRVSYDKDLVVFTSSRHVQKPFVIIMMDFCAHMAGFGAHLLAGSLASIGGAGKRPRLRPVTAALLSLAVAFMSIAAYGYFVPASPVFGKVYYRGDRAESMVALTFDDGPNEPYTSQILDILAAYDVKATFFLIGENVELYPDVARRIVAQGHVIGNHSYSHNANHALSGYGSRDLKLAQKAIYNATGLSPHLYRPPHGKKSPWELRTVKRTNLIEVNWSASANELKTRSPVALARKIVSETKPGGIILLHDGYGTEHNSGNSDKSLEVEALPLIIEKLQAEGYRFVTIPELLRMRPYND